MKNGMMCVIKLNSELCYEMLVEACILCFLVARIKAYCYTIEKKIYFKNIEFSAETVRCKKKKNYFWVSEILFLPPVRDKVLLQQD